MIREVEDSKRTAACALGLFWVAVPQTHAACSLYLGLAFFSSSRIGGHIFMFSMSIFDKAIARKMILVIEKTWKGYQEVATDKNKKNKIK